MHNREIVILQTVSRYHDRNNRNLSRTDKPVKNFLYYQRDFVKTRSFLQKMRKFQIFAAKLAVEPFPKPQNPVGRDNFGKNSVGKENKRSYIIQ